MLLKCSCVFCCRRCLGRKAHESLCKRGLRCISSDCCTKTGTARDVRASTTQYKHKLFFLGEGLKECRYGSAFNAPVRPPFLRGHEKLHKPSPDIFMWVTSRTPEGNAAFPCIKRWVGPVEGWSQTGLKIVANYLHMCRSGRNITDPPSALCIKRLESGYWRFIQSNEDKRDAGRGGDFKNHLLCCHSFNPNCFPVLKGVFRAFTQPVNLSIFNRQSTFSIQKKLFRPLRYSGF